MKPAAFVFFADCACELVCEVPMDALAMGLLRDPNPVSSELSENV